MDRADDWRYATTFATAAPEDGEHVDLVFDGLDTVAEVRATATTSSARRRTCTAPTGSTSPTLVRPGETELVVDFAAQLTATEQASVDRQPRVHTNAHPFNAIRKMACNFGWDWGPDLVTAGIWRRGALERWRTARLAAVRPLVTVVDGGRPGRGARRRGARHRLPR